MPRSPAEQLMYTTTRVKTYRNNQQVGSGTAFFFSVSVPDSPGSNIPLLITNKHVIDGADILGFRAHIGNSDNKPSGTVHECSVPLIRPHVIHHPDPEVDLCAIFIAGILKEALIQGKPIFYVSLAPDLIPTEEEWNGFDALESLLMVGCPRGIYDEVNNIPIFRRGFSATPLGKDYEGRKAFLIDMACYPGSSGSPILLYDAGSYHDVVRNAHVIGTRIKLVGVLFRGPLIDSQGRIVFQNIPRVEVQNMMHLGEVVKATEINVLMDEVLSFAAQNSVPASDTPAA